jgi:hypothetical protein
MVRYGLPMITPDTKIIPAEYPELALLIWSGDAARPILASNAFSIYERNWRFVDASRLSDREAQFVRDLTAAFSNGVMLAS